MSMARFNMDDHELQPMSRDIFSRGNGATRNDSQDPDRADLFRLGKRPVLRVGPAFAVKLLPRLMGPNLSVILASCPSWALAALFSPHGRQFLSTYCKYVNRETISDSHQSVFQLGLEKYVVVAVPAWLNE